MSIDLDLVTNVHRLFTYLTHFNGSNNNNIVISIHILDADSWSRKQLDLVTNVHLRFTYINHLYGNNNNIVIRIHILDADSWSKKTDSDTETGEHRQHIMIIISCINNTNCRVMLVFEIYPKHWLPVPHHCLDTQKYCAH